jgi:hypothetical protein
MKNKTFLFCVFRRRFSSRIKKIIQTGFPMIGAIAFFVGFTVNVQAIPILPSDNWNAPMSPRILIPDYLDYQVARSFDEGNHNQTFVSLNTLLIGSTRAPADLRHARTASQFHHRPNRRPTGPLVPIIPISTSPVISTSAPENVPDSGSTVLMLGGVFCGFVLLRRIRSSSRWYQANVV